MTPSYFFLDRLKHESESKSHSVMSDPLQPHGLYSPWNSPGQNTEVGSHSLFQGIFPTQGLNPGLPYCRRIFFYHLSHQGSPFKYKKGVKSVLQNLVKITGGDKAKLIKHSPWQCEFKNSAKLSSLSISLLV